MSTLIEGPQRAKTASEWRKLQICGSGPDWARQAPAPDKAMLYRVKPSS